MKAEINNENKAKFFAQYWGQDILCSDMYGDGGTIYSATMKGSSIKNEWIELKSLSDVCDEDAYGIGMLVNCWSKTERRMAFFKDDEMRETHIMAGKAFADCIGKDFGWGMSHPFANNSTDILHAYDFLRSRGYLVPWMGLSCEEIIEAGWAKYPEHLRI